MGHHDGLGPRVDDRPERQRTSSPQLVQTRVDDHLPVVAVGEPTLAWEVLGRRRDTRTAEPFGEGAGPRPRLGRRCPKGPIPDGASRRSTIGVGH